MKECITRFPKINNLLYSKRGSNRFDCVVGNLFASFILFKVIEAQIVDKIDNIDNH
jgi:hypothetical protein